MRKNQRNTTNQPYSAWQKRFALLFGVALILYTAWVLLDAFVIVRRYVDVQEAPLSLDAQATPDVQASVSTSAATPEMQAPTPTIAATPEITDTSYVDANIEIHLTAVRAYNTDIYVADVKLSDPSYLRTAFAENAYGRNITASTSAIAEENNAILAINGDYYGTRTDGYVLRNGVLYRENAASQQEDLVIWTDGTMETLKEDDVTAASLFARGAWQVFSFGPALVSDSSVCVDSDDEVSRAMTSNPRTAIGQIGPLHYVLVVSDGRTEQSEGLTLLELATFLQELGAQTAYNLDGGGSSTMVFNGAVVNHPTTSGNKIRERNVSDIVYIG